jgi:polyisoprenoid-binding protein YceI
MHRNRVVVASTLIGLSLLLAACGGQQGQVAAPTSAPATAKPAAPSPAGASPAASPAVPTVPPVGAASASPAASPSPNAALPGGAVRLTVVNDGTEARFRALEQFANVATLNEAVGTTNAVSGNIVLGAQGAVVPEQSKIVIDLTTLQTDEERRDAFIKRNTLQTDQFPNAELVVRQVTGLPWPLPTSGQVAFQLMGDLTLHGVTRPTVWEVQATMADRDVSGMAKTGVKMTDFGMTTPRTASVLSVNDDVALELSFRASRG